MDARTALRHGEGVWKKEEVEWLGGRVLYPLSGPL